MIRKLPAGDASTSELRWFKSSHSDSGSGSECVEVAAAPDAVHVRDSKNAQGPRLAVAPAAWAGFVSYAAAH
ncbi:DUF397 domain-containing protein [Streptomyces cyaneofuscatus]|uniref:DUF397 domain-containing protein n=1 Tax=Streptomyces TaxID=1883 RepID=UPI0003A14324|nr:MULTISPECIES: DUF397 domain-containing protein [unclassified Streptomyces]MZF58234.1 DUF397 domain-containing protein [Streptomyces sp. SID5594]